jgi:hypothetical protein
MGLSDLDIILYLLPASDLDKFERQLLESIINALRNSLGDANAQLVFQYLEKRSCPILEIPRRLELFSAELRKLIGSGRIQNLDVATALEETITKAQYFKAGTKTMQQKNKLQSFV